MRWIAAALALFSFWLWLDLRQACERERLLKEQIELQREVMAIQDEWCWGVHDNAKVCEDWVVMMIDQLGVRRRMILTNARAQKRLNALARKKQKRMRIGGR